MTVQHPHNASMLRIAVSRLTPRVLVDLTEAVADHNVAIMKKGNIPMLYTSGEVYLLDGEDEPWFDVVEMLRRGGGDCEDLVAKRMAEHRTYGARGLRPGDIGHGLLTGKITCRARMEQYSDGATHMQLELLVNGVWVVEDPAARLGMKAGVVDPQIKQRWVEAGVRQLRTPRWR